MSELESFVVSPEVRRVLRGFQVQFTVIQALILRETRTRFGLNRLGYVWALVEPITVIATFYAAFTISGNQSPTGMDMVSFIATGLLPFELVMGTADRVAESINGNRALLFYPQVHRLDLVWARGILEASTIAVVFAIIVGTNAFVRGGLVIDDLLSLTATFALAMVFGTALGLVYCMGSVLSTLVDRIRAPLGRPMFWISGIFFTSDAIPSHVREFALANPVMHVLEMFRSAFYTSYESRVARPSYVIGWTIGLLALGLLLERVARRKIEVAD